MKTLVMALVLISGCASTGQPGTAPGAPGAANVPPTPAPSPAPGALAGAHDRVSDAADAAVILAKVEDFEKHPMPPERASAPSDKLFKNIELLHDMTGERVIGAMFGMSHALGANCMACHVEKNFPSDDKKEKGFARGMMLAAEQINHDFFGGKTRVTCFTCHQGQKKPERTPADFMARADAIQVTGTLPAVPPDAKAAGDAYKNLQVLSAQAPADVVPLMKAVSASLGVGCDHCHVTGDWASDDKKPKLAARAMIKLTREANGAIFGNEKDEDAIRCWTCHRGAPEPKPFAG